MVNNKTNEDKMKTVKNEMKRIEFEMYGEKCFVAMNDRVAECEIAQENFVNELELYRYAMHKSEVDPYVWNQIKDLFDNGDDRASLIVSSYGNRGF